MKHDKLIIETHINRAYYNEESFLITCTVTAVT